MNIPKIPEGEYRFCLIMWEHEPVSSLELVKLCQERLAWLSNPRPQEQLWSPPRSTPRNEFSRNVV